jgi:hypothetical protein
MCSNCRAGAAGVGRIFESRALLESQFLGRGLTAIYGVRQKSGQRWAEQMDQMGWSFHGIRIQWDSMWGKKWNDPIE